MLVFVKMSDMARGSSYLSKRRYADIRCMLIEELQSDETVGRILERFDSIMNFDNRQSTYTEMMAKRILAWRRRKMDDARAVQ